MWTNKQLLAAFVLLLSFGALAGYTITRRLPPPSPPAQSMGDWMLVTNTDGNPSLFRMADVRRVDDAWWRTNTTRILYSDGTACFIPNAERSNVVVRIKGQK